MNNRNTIEIEKIKRHISNLTIGKTHSKLRPILSNSHTADTTNIILNELCLTGFSRPGCNKNSIALMWSFYSIFTIGRLKYYYILYSLKDFKLFAGYLEEIQCISLDIEIVKLDKCFIIRTYEGLMILKQFIDTYKPYIDLLSL